METARDKIAEWIKSLEAALREDHDARKKSDDCGMYSAEPKQNRMTSREIKSRHVGSPKRCG
jgi:hypothetical protein